VFDGDACLGWCRFGAPDEVPRITTVDDFIARSDHRRIDDVIRLRAAILAISSSVTAAARNRRDLHRVGDPAGRRRARPPRSTSAC
jgi:hypothetical protein